MKKFIALILSFLTALLFVGCFKPAYYTNYQIIFKNSAITLQVKLYGGDNKKAYDEMIERMDIIDNELSLSITTSKFYYFNEMAKADEKVEISSDAYNMLELALEIENETNGAFSIGVNNLSKLWNLDTEGYSQYDPLADNALDFTLPTYNKVKETLSSCDTSNLVIEEIDGKYYMSKTDARLKIDLGAIAKGYATDICYEIAIKHGVTSGIINISGNIYFIGQYQDGNEKIDWELGINAPRPRFDIFRDDVCSFNLSGDISAVTSGDYQRYYRHVSGIYPSHIINPRTGLPAGVEYIGNADGSENLYRMQSESISSATVIYASSAKADAYSTAVFVMGLDEGMEFIKTKENIKSVIFTDKFSDTETDYKKLNDKLAIVGDIIFLDNDKDGYKNYTLVD